jgi:hypothetical protein
LPRPTDETIARLRELYQERERTNRILDRVLSKLSSLLRKQEDYADWLENDGRIDKLPEWIHEVTGGRPLYHSQRPVVQQRRKPKPKEPTFLVSEERQDKTTDKLFRLMDKKGGESID